MMRRVLATVALVFSMVVMQFTPAHAATPAELIIDAGAIPQGKAGQPVEITVPLFNKGETDAKGVVVIPQLSTNAEAFPFEITSQSLATPVGTVEAGKGVEVNLGELSVRNGLKTGYYALPLKIQQQLEDKVDVVDKAIFIHVEGVAEPAPSAPDPITTTPPQTVEILVNRNDQAPAGVDPSQFGAGSAGGAPDLGGSGGFSGGSDLGSALGGSGAGAGSGSVPRVMLTSFSTDPLDVMAGSEFTLSIGLSNMSRSASVGNLKITVTSPESALLPVSGASSAYVDSISAGGGAGVSFNYKALPTLEERPYQLALHLEYENNADHSPVVAEETIAIIVSQPTRAETSQLKATPTDPYVDQDVNVSFTIQNLGKSILQNAKVKLKDNPALSAEEVFVGNIAPGTAGAADIMLTTLQPGLTQAILEISYENAAGKQSRFERSIDLEVTDRPAEESVDEIEYQGPGIGAVMVPLLLLLLIAAIVAAFLINKRRKRRKAAQLQESMSHLDASPIVPPDAQ